MEINLKQTIKPFSLPNYLNNGKIDVGTLSLSEAGDLWDKMRDQWMNHVIKRKHILVLNSHVSNK